MIGPQYPLSLHRKLVAGELTDRPGQVPNSVGPGLAKMLMGIALLGYSQVAGMYFYPTYMEEEAFFALPYFKKLGYISITGIVYMYKVILIFNILSLVHLNLVYFYMDNYKWCHIYYRIGIHKR